MSYKALFEVPNSGPYLLAHSVGCLPARTRAAFEDAYLTPWAQKGGDAWPDWLTAIDNFRGSLAQLLGGRLDDYCPQPNLSAALYALLSALPHRKDRNVIVASAHSFPSLGFVIQQAESLGLRLELLPEDRDPGDPTIWDQALRSDVAAVLVMHVHSNTGVVSPIEDIAAMARDRGIVSIIDVAQSAGILPIDVATLGATALIGSCVKWLCGGPGAGFLWIDPVRVTEFTPRNVGWFSHENPFEFDIRDFRYAPDARRFWGGTPSVAPYILAASGITLINEIGVPAILAHNRSLIARVAEQAPDHLRPQFDRTTRGGTICLQPGDDIDRIAASFSARNAKFDRRGNTLRLSFHLWNDEADADLVAESMC